MLKAQVLSISELLAQAAVQCASMSSQTLHAKLVNGPPLRLRLLSGNLVDAETAAAYAIRRGAETSTETVEGVNPILVQSSGGGLNSNAATILATVAASTRPADPMKGLKAESIGVSSTDGPSIAARERAALQKASSRVIDLLQRLGPHSAVHRECYGAGGSVNGELLETLLRVVCGKLFASAVDSYCKEVGKYLDWLVAIRRSPVEVGPVTLCGYLRASLSRGSSVPTKVRAALCWCQSHIKVLLGAAGVEVRDFTEQFGRASPGGLVKEKDQAPLLPVDFCRRP